LEKRRTEEAESVANDRIQNATNEEQKRKQNGHNMAVTTRHEQMIMIMIMTTPKRIRYDTNMNTDDTQTIGEEDEERNSSNT